ncbi:MAG: AgmX/PglI C-terminal domain-containing protein [Deltaproteobacteria bacterium]|nr:AgmX/PglI C-terminal domain-containing protein [Deltaproteobacteria bacterium]
MTGSNQPSRMKMNVVSDATADLMAERHRSARCGPPVKNRRRLHAVCALATAAVLVGTLGMMGGCGSDKSASLPKAGDHTVGNLTVVRAPVSMQEPDGKVRPARSGQRIFTGETVSCVGRALVDHDQGVRVLLDRNSKVTLTDAGIKLLAGRAWVETTRGFHPLVQAAGLTVKTDGAAFELTQTSAGPSIYLVRGTAHYETKNSAGDLEPGDQLTLAGDKVRIEPVAMWDDWTGGLAWPAPRWQKAPAGLGEVGARMPGSTGKARFPLSVRSLRVQATIRGDLALVRVEQEFFNPVSETLEGIYRIRLPKGAILHGFGIDRNGKMVYGYIKERSRARAQYQAQVYQGSTDDPALLEWDAPGVYRARIYPIAPGSTRKVVIVYSQWIERQAGIRRWVYPMGNAGAAGIRIGELEIKANLIHAKASRVDASLGARLDRGIVVLRRSDYIPPADLVVSIHGKALGKKSALGLISKEQEKGTPYYLARLMPLPLAPATKDRPLDLVLVVDLSAGTDPTRLQLARTIAEALTTHLGAKDRLALLGGDLSLHPLTHGALHLVAATTANKTKLLDRLVRTKVGGATDMGAVLTQAARLLQPGRRGAIVYLGDAMPTVGELDLASLKKRLSRLTTPIRLYGVAVGQEANLDLLAGLTESGGRALRVTDQAGAGRAALRIAEHLARPVMQKVTVDLGPTVEQVYPRRPVTVVAGHPLMVAGRLKGKAPGTITLVGLVNGKEVKQQFSVDNRRLDDGGDLKLRWATYRLAQLLTRGAGREEMVELGTRFGLITPYTSFYVPSTRQLDQDGEEKKKVQDARKKAERILADLNKDKTQRDQAAKNVQETKAEKPADEKEETKAQPATTGAAKPSGRPIAAPPVATARPQKKAPRARSMTLRLKGTKRGSEAGLVVNETTPGIARGDSGGGSGHGYGGQRHRRRNTAETAGVTASLAKQGSQTNLDGLDARAQLASTEQGRTRHGDRAAAAGDGFAITGNKRPKVTGGRARVSGSLDKGIIRRIILRHINQVRYCYESRALARNPHASGLVTVQFAIGSNGRVRTARIASTTLHNPASERCIALSVRRWRFPKPRGGGLVVVRYPFKFQSNKSAGQEQTRARRVAVDVDVHVDIHIHNHLPSRCSPAAKKPLAARRRLWRERLASRGGIRGVMEVWIDARQHCELHTWTDRRVLLSAMLNRLGSARSMLALYRRFHRSWGIRRFLRRAILGRVRRQSDLRIVLRALGLDQQIQLSMVRQVLARLTRPDLKIAALQKLLVDHPANAKLTMLLLDQLETANRWKEGLPIADSVEGNPYADPDLRVNVAEFLLRHGKQYETRARRILSELVEFRPTDPSVRRRLGDLYRAHGWFDEAYRQYQTLASLRPQDMSVLLLMASAAAGAGRLDEALRLEQRVASTAEPGSATGLARWALLWTSLRLMKLRWKARLAGKSAVEELARLLARTRRSGVLDLAHPMRVALTWSHPSADVELHVGVGSYHPSRAPLLGSLYGIEAFDAAKIDKAGYRIEVKRVGRPTNRIVRAELAVMWNEGKPNERLWTKTIVFKRNQNLARFKIQGGKVEEVQ